MDVILRNVEHFGKHILVVRLATPGHSRDATVIAKSKESEPKIPDIN